MHQLMKGVSDHADAVAQFIGAFIIALFSALFTYWLTKRVRARADRQEERAALQVQADALGVAMADVRAAAIVNHTLWESPASRGRSFLLALLACAGGAARGRVAGGTDGLSFAIGMGEAALLLSRERRASNQAIAAVREPLLRLATAAAPLLRHPNAQVADAAEAVLAAASNIENHASSDVAVAAFGRAVRAALQPPPTLWARICHRLRPGPAAAGGSGTGSS
ncbi:hypothetical protein [Streptomyces sp. NPDC006335]|uniref:hypothetical protein n=1 Tax=Streptomyces sp. NPDC006335 TaxID=3156895 RepID=UPI0033BE927A